MNRAGMSRLCARLRPISALFCPAGGRPAAIRPKTRGPAAVLLRDTFSLFGVFRTPPELRSAPIPRRLIP
jgi:hypothetical protein